MYQPYSSLVRKKESHQRDKSADNKATNRSRSKSKGKTKVPVNQQPSLDINSKSQQPVIIENYYPVINNDVPDLINQNQQLENQIRQFKDILGQKNIQLSELQAENCCQFDRNNELEGKLNQYKNSLQKLYDLHHDQSVKLEQCQKGNTQMLNDMENMTQQIFDLKAQVSSLEYENEKLKQNNQMDTTLKNNNSRNLQLQIDKIQMENQKLRKRNNDLLDLKRQLENKLQQLEFQLGNLDQKLQMQMKDGYLNMNNKDRQFNQELYNRDSHIQGLENELQGLKNQNQKMADQLNLQLQKQAMDKDYINRLERDNPNRNDDIDDDGYGYGSTTRINKNQQAGVPDRNSLQDLKQQHRREMDQIVDDYQRKIDDLERQLGRGKVNLDQLEFKVTDNRNKNELLKAYCTLLVNAMTIIYSEIYEFLMQIYENCITTEKVNNQSAKVLFVKEMERVKKHKNGKGQKLGYQLFSYVKKMIKKVVKIYGNEMDEDDETYQILKAYTGIIVKNKHRLDADRETEEEVKNIIKHQEGEPKINTKKYFLDLFRLLQIKHRYLYPSNNIRSKMDSNLDAFINLKIMNSFKKIMKELFVFQYQNYIYFQNLVQQQKDKEQLEG